MLIFARKRGLHIIKKNKNKKNYYYSLKSRRGESNFISAIRSIIDADMARQQRVHGIFKDFYVIQNRFSCSAHQ